MRRKIRFYKMTTLVSLVLTIAMLGVLIATSVMAENTTQNAMTADYSIQDGSPAIYVAQKNAASVVGVITLAQSWNGNTRQTSSQTYSEGSGVVIAAGGYILTNNHVISGGDAYQVLMPSGEKVDAELVGADSSYDLAVLKVSEGADTLTPAAIGSVNTLSVGSTVVAIGNPGGETLNNTVTNGIVSCLSRNVDGGNTTRTVDYVQHNAAINSGNSGGGLFDINGNLIGINTLKYSGSAYSTTAYEGLGFAIPVDTAYPIAMDLIEYGTVQRVGLGVTISEVDGADEATNTMTPAGLLVQSVTENGPAANAGVQNGDYITAINGERITSTEELTDVLDQFEEGDTVKLTVVRYTAANGVGRSFDSEYTPTAGYADIFGNIFGGYGNGYGYGYGSDSGYGNGYGYGASSGSYTCETLTLDVKLAILK